MLTIREKTNAESINIVSVKTDGEYISKLFEQMRKNGWNEEHLQKLLMSAAKVVQKFTKPDPSIKIFNKILCIGKVQSGKTSFFISSLALAFDNGYKLAYVIGGTKTDLLTQNSKRIQTEFGNNSRRVLIRDMNSVSEEEISNLLVRNIRVILMVLKDKHGSVNLNSMIRLTKMFSHIPSIIIDDEADEVSVGAAIKGSTNNKGIVHNAIISILDSVGCGTLLSVTATPQANLLISAENKLSPDQVYLVNPGEGYTGASTFHDTVENPLVYPTEDSCDFENGVPESFKRSLYEFLIGTAVRRFREGDVPHSMLVHPSSLTSVHKDLYKKIDFQIDNISSILRNDRSIGYQDLVEIISELYHSLDFTKPIPSFEELLILIKENITFTKVFEINTKTTNNIDQIESDNFYLYRIYVGGGKIERGITLFNLSVVYMYRQARKNPMDTMLQRARWFGYKKEYLDLCKIYMPHDLIGMFVDIYQSEEFMWRSIEKYVSSGLPLKEMKRIFALKNSRLMLTRKSVSKTIPLSKYVYQGYIYDRAVSYHSDEERLLNLRLLENYISKQEVAEKYTYMTKTGEHTHLVFEVSFRDFFTKVIDKYNFPIQSDKICKATFKNFLELIDNGVLTDEILLIKMRDNENQYRSLSDNKMFILELPQSYDKNNGYVGDKSIKLDRLSIQIHYNYLDKTNEGKKNLYPSLVINNPFINPKIIEGLVTGEKYVD